MIPVAIFLTMNLLVISSAYLFTFKLLKFKNSIDSLICWFLIYFSQIIFTELALGINGSLTLVNLIVFNLCILIVIKWITRKNKSSLDLSGIKTSLFEILSNRMIRAGASIILGFGLVKVLINLVNPPFGWDSLNYHFTFPVEWLKNFNLEMPIVVSDDPNPSYYPINASLYFLWLIFPFKSVFIADLGQLPFFLVAFLAIYNLAKKIGINREYSLYAAILFLVIPNIFKQLEVAYVDMILAGLFLAGLNFVFLLKEEFINKNVVIFAVILGLLLGTKTIGLPYALILSLPFFYLTLRHANKIEKLVIFSVPLILLGAFSYLRNFLLTNNPLYPLDFILFGQTVFKGVTNIGFYTAHYKPADYRLTKLLFHEGLGVQTIIFVLPSILSAFILFVSRQRRRLNFVFAYFLILPLLIYLVYYYLIPFKTPRYLYSLLGAGLVIAFYLIDLLKVPRKLLKVLIAVCLIASVSELASHLELISSIVMTVLSFFVISLLIKLPAFTPLKFRYFNFTLFLILILGLTFLYKDYRQNEYKRYITMQDYSGFWPDATSAWSWLNDNSTADNIAYVGRPVPFPLYGTDFKNQVYYVSVNAIDPVKLHYFPRAYYRREADYLTLHENLKAEGNYRGQADYQIWIKNLKKRQTDYLFIYSLHQTKKITFPLEDQWAVDNPDKFETVFENKTIRIYKFKK